MSIAEDYLNLVRTIARRLRLPAVKEIFLPPRDAGPCSGTGFGAVVLEDGSTGLMFVRLDETLNALADRRTGLCRTDPDPVSLANGFVGDDPGRRAIALGTINAIGQHVLARSGYVLDHGADSFAALAPEPGDRIGMVGYFPPLVAQLREIGVPVTVIELDADLIARDEQVEVTLDPTRLGECSKVLCTSTVILNDTLDRILGCCRNAEAVAIVGPSAGFLPDPLFERGVHAVGANRIVDSSGFLACCRARKKWGETSEKYLIRRERYPGAAALLERIPPVE